MDHAPTSHAEEIAADRQSSAILWMVRVVFMFLWVAVTFIAIFKFGGETGRAAVYVNSIHTLGFENMSREESLPLLEYLYQQVTRPEYSFRLRWEADTLAMWDNRCTQHYALNDYHGYRRVMHRIIVEGDVPG